MNFSTNLCFVVQVSLIRSLLTSLSCLKWYNSFMSSMLWIFRLKIERRMSEIQKLYLNFFLRSIVNSSLGIYLNSILKKLASLKQEHKQIRPLIGKGRRIQLFSQKACKIPGEYLYSLFFTRPYPTSFLTERGSFIL